jgi:hypothetical protein
VDGHPVLGTHLVKLIDAHHAPISQHHGPALQAAGRGGACMCVGHVLADHARGSSLQGSVRQACAPAGDARPKLGGGGRGQGGGAHVLGLASPLLPLTPPPLLLHAHASPCHGGGGGAQAPSTPGAQATHLQVKLPAPRVLHDCCSQTGRAAALAAGVHTDGCHLATRKRGAGSAGVAEPGHARKLEAGSGAPAGGMGRRAPPCAQTSGTGTWLWRGRPA